MLVYIARFSSHRYPEDNEILGVYSTVEKAEHAIQLAIDIDKSANPGYPARYQQRRDYYHIDDFEVDN